MDRRRFTALLERLEARWLQQGAPIAFALAPGLTAGAIEARVGQLAYPLPDEARWWFSWHNGVVARAPGKEQGQRARLGPSTFEALSLEESVRFYHRNIVIARETVRSDDVPVSAYWDTSWFPIAASLHSSFLTVDCSVPPNEPTPIRVVEGQDERRAQVLAGSLSEVIELWIRMFELGVLWFDMGRDEWKFDDTEMPPNVPALLIA